MGERSKLTIPLMLGILFGWAVLVSGQNQASDPAAGLRSQLADLQARVSELENRLAELAEQSKPENIEMSLAGVGTTHPEILREQRRRQLETEKTNIQKQLQELRMSETRLEAAINRTDADMYQLNAGVKPAPAQAGSPANSISTANSQPIAPTKSHRKHKRR